MQNRTKGNKRVLAKKVTSFNMFFDQATQVHAIMESAGNEKDAPVLRELLDEALAARRRRAAGVSEPEDLESIKTFAETLETVKALMLRAVRQSEKSLRIEALNLGLLQETLSEAHAARRLCWNELSIPPLREKGIIFADIESRFEGATAAARDYAYALSRELKNEATGIAGSVADGTHLTSELQNGEKAVSQ